MRLAQLKSNASKYKFRFCNTLGLEINAVSQQNKEKILLNFAAICFFHVLRDLYCDFYSTLHINFTTSEIFY